MQNITEITIYKCDDGSEFKNKNDAVKYVNTYEKLNQTISLLNDIRIESKFCSWIIIHTKEKVDAYKKSICKLAVEYYPSNAEIFIKYNAGEISCNDVVMVLNTHKNEIIENSNINVCLYNAFYRLNCIDDKTYIEYPSTYYIKQQRENSTVINIGDNFGTINIC